MTITLIGMPAVGKSSIGRAVAKRLGYRFIDPDKLIEKQYGSKLQDLIDRLGAEEFKRIEEKTLLSISADNAVIAPGGSAVYYDAAMRHLGSLGPVIYLSAGLDTIKMRLGDFSRRGVVLGEGQTIDDLYEERLPLFKKYADYTVDCNSSAYSKFQRQVMEYIEKHRA